MVRRNGGYVSDTTVGELKLRPCPFCGSENVKGVEDDGIGAITCYGCGAVVSFNGHEKLIEAAFAWNKREEK